MEFKNRIVAKSSNMRGCVIFGSLVALIVMLFALWAFRFERTSGLPTWRLADLRTASPTVESIEWTGSQDSPRIRMAVNFGSPVVASRIKIPGVMPVEGLHLRFQMVSKDLVPGKNDWEDGRFMIDWKSPMGLALWENNPVSSIRGNNPGAIETLVILPGHRPSVPYLRFEHLGRSGEFEISDLEITAVQERLIWKIGRWLLAIAWLGWGVTIIRYWWPEISRVRAALASMAWLVMSIYLVIPGPWKLQRAMYPSFQLGKVSSVTSNAEKILPSSETETMEIASQPVKTLGSIAFQGSSLMRVKLMLIEARPVLHALLLAAPALMFALLVGRRPALFLAASLAIAIELSQLAFGYGFDWIDVVDLLCDAIGISLALWVYGKIPDKYDRKLRLLQ
ncbi:MAG: VanZ family protein [Gloeobacteraceae cyanobacterium ES-bin-144]|nr:VanZ family protein [Verrucomicrobiales bacterium]